MRTTAESYPTLGLLPDSLGTQRLTVLLSPTLQYMESSWAALKLRLRELPHHCDVYKVSSFLGFTLGSQLTLLLLWYSPHHLDFLACISETAQKGEELHTFSGIQPLFICTHTLSNLSFPIPSGGIFVSYHL